MNKSPEPNNQERIIHVYDGIEEADNDLPQWWLFLVYATIVFAVGYWFTYHAFEAAPLPMAAYTEELAKASQASGTVSEDFLVAMASDSAAVSAGHEVFEKNCIPCHEADGRGKIGPNLTDGYWLHGGGPVDIWTTVSGGAPNGMPAWKGPLGPRNVEKVVAFVLSIRNTNVPGGKAPQGALWSADGAAKDEAAAPAP